MAASCDAGGGPRRVGVAITASVAASAAAVAAVIYLKRRRQTRSQDAKGCISLFDGREKGFYREEVASHNQSDDAWITLNGGVYDVTSWLNDHPGGRLLLLAFAGRDATEPFESVGHSAIAHRELRRLRKGHIVEGGTKATRKGNGRLTRSATLTGGSSCLPRSLTSDCELVNLDAAVWCVAEQGFMPSSDPVGVEALQGTAFEVVIELVDLLPMLSMTGALRRRFDDSVELQQRFRACDAEMVESLTEAQCERAFAAVGYIMIAYWRGGTLPYSTGMSCDGGAPTAVGGSCGETTEKVQKLPDFLATPMLALSERLGRPPMPDYAATVLYNWVRIDSTGPISSTNIRCALRLTGLLDEEWFFKTHVVIEAESAQLVSALVDAMNSKDDSILLNKLVAIEESLWRVVRLCLPMMYDRDAEGVPKCSENVFYQILRPLIKSGQLEFDGASPSIYQLSGPSGAMSSLMPCVDAALGIETSSEKLRNAIRSFEKSMPREHRAFIDKIRGQMTIRQRLLLSRPRAGDPHAQHDTLIRSFNRCVARVLDFRWSHWQYVKNFIMKPGNLSFAVGSGGTSFDFLQQHITDTERARLVEHEEVLTRLVSPTGPDWPSMSQPTLRTHPSHEFWSVDGEHGFLARDPLTTPGANTWDSSLSDDTRKALLVLWDLACRMPALVACDGPFYERVEEETEKLLPLHDDRSILGMPEAAREFLMTTLCHVAAACSVAGPGKPLPRAIARPLKVVARSVGRPSLLGFTEIMLCNWSMSEVRQDSSQQIEVTGEVSEQKAPQLHVVWRFLGSPDEEWYRGMHVILHHQARDAIAAIRVGQVAMIEKSDQGVMGSLGKLLEWMTTWTDYFNAHFEAKDSRTEEPMYRRLEPFMKHSKKATTKEMAAWVYCSGSSPILPVLHAFLGLKMCATKEGSTEENGDLGTMMRTLLEEMRMCMPRQHRTFLEELEKPGANVRQYCLRRFGAKAVSVETLHGMEVSYNDALNALVRFLACRMELVSRFYPRTSGIFGVFHADVEDMMRKRRLQLLEMRQRVGRCLEK